MLYPLGAKIVLTDTVQINGALADPISPVVCVVTKGNAVTTTYTDGISPEMAHPSIGRFTCTIYGNVAGDWTATFYVPEDSNDDPGASFVHAFTVVANAQVPV